MVAAGLSLNIQVREGCEPRGKPEVCAHSTSSATLAMGGGRRPMRRPRRSTWISGGLGVDKCRWLGCDRWLRCVVLCCVMLRCVGICCGALCCNELCYLCCNVCLMLRCIVLCCVVLCVVLCCCEMGWLGCVLCCCVGLCDVENMFCGDVCSGTARR